MGPVQDVAVGPVQSIVLTDPPPPEPSRTGHHRQARATTRPPGSQHEEIARVLGFFDPAGPAGHSQITRPAVLPSVVHERVGIPDKNHFGAQYPGPRAPRTNASLRPRGSPTHGQGHRDLLGLRCRTLSFLSSCRLSGAFHAQVLRPRGVRRQLAIALPAMWPSAYKHGVGTPNRLISVAVGTGLRFSG